MFLCLLSEDPQRPRLAGKKDNRKHKRQLTDITDTKKRLPRRKTNGGDEEIRTPDLVSAIHALSQLSYVPTSTLPLFFNSSSDTSTSRRSKSRAAGVKYRIECMQPYDLGRIVGNRTTSLMES